MRHTRISTLLLATLACADAAGQAPLRLERGNLVYEGIPAEAMTAPASLPGWLDARGAGLLDWLADGSLLVAMRAGDAAQLHRVRKAMAAPEQLTRDAEPITSATAHPYDANLVVYRKDRGGDENTQLWLRNLAEGSERLLTDGKSRHGLPVFAQDGRRIAYSGNARDPASNDIFMSDIMSGAGPRLVLAGGSEDLDVQDWSLDDTRLAVIRYRSSTDSEVAAGGRRHGRPGRQWNPCRRESRAGAVANRRVPCPSARRASRAMAAGFTSLPTAAVSSWPCTTSISPLASRTR